MKRSINPLHIFFVIMTKYIPKRGAWWIFAGVDDCVSGLVGCGSSDDEPEIVDDPSIVSGQLTIEIDTDSFEVIKPLEEIVSQYGLKMPITIEESSVLNMNQGGTDFKDNDTYHTGDSWIDLTIDKENQTYTLKAPRNRDGQHRCAVIYFAIGIYKLYTWILTR